MKFCHFALLGAASLAVAKPNAHNHAHHHVGKRGSRVEVREVSNVVFDGPVITVYELNGKVISAEEVDAGIKSGKYILVGETLQTAPKPPPAAAPTPTPSPKAAEKPAKPEYQAAAVFAEKKSSSSSEAPKATPTPDPSPEPTPSKSVESPKETVVPSDSGSNSEYKVPSGEGDIGADFPSGKIPCSSFPSKYGAISLEWLKLGGWSGIQAVPDYTTLSKTISTIHTSVSGGCNPGAFCSYACPEGYQKSQWPEAQGSTGQSIGGLFCNSKGMLELSRPTHKQICVQGAGGVKVQNKLRKNVAICRTDYPGTESETIPLDTQPGGIYELTCPEASDYYQWEGKATSAQYYVNPAGVPVEKACQWGRPGTNMGNWAPLNIGCGKTAAGTFISVFRNTPTNMDGSLDFTITITGDVSGKCVYKNNKFYNNGVESPTGCTAAVNNGGTATFVFTEE
ncbi:hypothetical protein HYALB_00002098 [Hymenoscyphus albidus]|uniref:Uncharacterized protein n=1 Tax=Hymenoscyphus albidus TaxID=595503 RepID=A0A9N9LP18_9HELO|nr:hypothetical protein HYALB_00002098 [Hymenoscyphus albidus]